MGRRFVNVLGGFLRWIFTNWYLRRPLRMYFEKEDGTEDTKQTWMNFVVVFIFVLLLAVLSEYLFKSEPKEFMEY